jgi:hypothetical protein
MQTESTCKTCQHIKRGPMTPHGFNACGISPVWESFPATHWCDHHITESPESRAARMKAKKPGQ